MVPGAEGSARGRRLLRLLRTDRLRKRFEFGRVRDQGRRVHTKSFVLVLRKNGEERTRLGLTVSSKVGPAVRRNRVKRLLREVFRLRRELFPRGADVVVIAKAGTLIDSFGDVEHELQQVTGVMRSALQGGQPRERGTARKKAAPAERAESANDRPLSHKPEEPVR